jgi:hypothetical protein
VVLDHVLDGQALNADHAGFRERCGWRACADSHVYDH